MMERIKGRRGVSAHSSAMWILCLVHELPFSIHLTFFKIVVGIMELPGKQNIHVPSISGLI